MRIAALISLIIGLLTVSSRAQAPQKLPNIEYLSFGYDLVHGNPLGASPQEPSDPGWTLAPVISFTYTQNKTTSDGRWLLPDQVDAAPSIACDFISVASTEQGISDYQSNAESDVQITVGYNDLLGSAAFSASYGYQQASQLIEQQDQVLISTKAFCQNYIAKLAPETYNITSDFRARVARLPLSNASLAEYYSLIADYGTHYTLLVYMGAKAIIQYQSSSSSYQKMVSQGVSVSVGGQLSFMNFYGETVNQDTNGYADYEAFQQSISSSSIYGLGAAPPVVQGATSWQAWEDTIADSPLPMKYQLAPISDLLGGAYFPEDQNIALKQALLSAAMQSYCGQVPNCTVPPPPPPPIAPWPQYRMNSAHTAQSPFIGPTNCLLKWQIPNSRFGAMLIGVDGTMYLGGYALNTTTQDIKWNFTAPGRAALASNGILYAFFGNTTVALDATNGGLLFQFEAPNVTTGVAWITQLTIGPDDDIYVVAENGDPFYRLTRNLSVVWQHPMYIQGAGAPAVGPNDVVYLSCDPGDGTAHVIAFDGSTGDILWDNQLMIAGDYAECSPCPDVVIGLDGNLYVGPFDYQGVLLALSPSGVVVWTAYATSAGQYVLPVPPAIGVDGTIFFLSFDVDSQSTVLAAITPGGHIAWRLTVDSNLYPIAAPVVGADGTVYVAVPGGYFYAIASTGSLLWRFAFPSAWVLDPVIGADGTVYLLTADNLYAFGRTEGTAC